MQSKKIRFAVMGLGHIAQAAVLPAFKHADNAELVALISETPEKLAKLGRKYKVPVSSRFLLSDFPQCLQGAGIDALYLATPNDTHCEYAIQALNAGVHVLCEKPLAISIEECNRMLTASERNQKLLMTAYRLHFEQSNLETIKLIKSKKIGTPRIFNSTFTMQVQDQNNIRLGPTFEGGGPLWDIGIYCINAARSIFRSEPTEVFAFAENNGERRFELIDEAISVILRFPGNRLAQFCCSFGADSCATYDVVGTKGRLHVHKAYEYASERSLCTYRDDELISEKEYPQSDQFAAELIYFTDCIHQRRKPEPSAIEGRADVRVILSILDSLDSGKPIKLKPETEHVTHPQPSQLIKKPANTEPRMVKVSAPSKKT